MRKPSPALFVLALALIACASNPLSAQVPTQLKLPALFTSHMVVQRDRPVHVWGSAGRNQSLTVSFREERIAAHADDLGRWRVDFSPKPAGGPFQIIVSDGANSVTLDDVMAGDVWIAGGQSNMEFPMTDLLNPQQQIAAAQCPNVRLFRVQHRASMYPLDDVTAAPWEACNPGTIASFSAVAYFFARDIAEREHVTVGVIQSAWGGTLAESWTSLDALSANAGLMPVFAARAHMMDSQVTNALQQQLDEADKAAGKTVPPRPWNPLPEMWEPAWLFNGMIAPLTPFTIRGVLWYQGESNSKLDRAPLYARLFPAMIADWRQHWQQGDFPFLFTQISNFKSDASEDWPTVRDAQRRTLAVANTAMAVTIDVGDPANVHPKDKATVGARLALAARALVYGEQVEYSGPLYRELTHEPDNRLRLWFDHAAGLNARNQQPLGFEIAGADGHFVTATAKIENDTVLLSAPGIAAPTQARYDWANSPDGNLFNAAHLPMSPFTTRP